jgi:syntaxin-binding protein 1
MPTSQNVDRIIRDFSHGNQQYAAAHLFFIEGMWLGRCNSLLATFGMANEFEGLNEQLFQKLTSSPAEPFLKGLQELFINFWGMWIDDCMLCVYIDH